MQMATIAERWTLEEFHALPGDGSKCEVIRGELYMTPPSTLSHETAGAKLNRLIVNFVDQKHPETLEGASAPLGFSVEGLFERR